MKVFVVGESKYYSDFIENCELVDDLKDADVVLFTGGEDVSPSLYKCKKYESTYCNPDRDRVEVEVFKQIKPNQLVLGICRGSQFLCVMNGGLLVQDCCNHAIGSTHEITNGNMMYQITSTHHQMQYPFNLNEADFKLLYWSKGLSNFYEGDKIKSNLISMYGEPEIVLYHKKNCPKCLAIQGHPEMIPDSPVSKMINNLIKTYSK